nr:hypothetical protein [Tanacetum cinerariifolium]
VLKSTPWRRKGLANVLSFGFLLATLWHGTSCGPPQHLKTLLFLQRKPTSKRRYALPNKGSDYRRGSLHQRGAMHSQTKEVIIEEEL